MKNYILAICVAAALFSCDNKEKAHLQFKVDSLHNVLVQSRKTEVAMNEVGVLLDSIDASRHLLHTKIVEGLSYADYIVRLKDINMHIKDSQEKLLKLEKGMKDTKNISLVTIRRLKEDLDLRSKEIVALQLDVVNLRTKTQNQEIAAIKQDSVTASQVEIIKLRNANVASLEGLVKDTNDQNRIKVAGLYFAQAQALETAANRTKFAPRKKKETRREALELYKLSFSLGKVEAEAKIQELEKALS